MLQKSAAITSSVLTHVDPTDQLCRRLERSELSAVVEHVDESAGPVFVVWRWRGEAGHNPKLHVLKGRFNSKHRIACSFRSPRCLAPSEQRWQGALFQLALR